MADFSKNISDFINYGVYSYQFDNVGNEILNPSSSIFQQVYFVLPTILPVYNNSKILSFYDTNFTEFVPTLSSSTNPTSSFPQAAIDQINNVTYQNTQLQSQLQSLIANSEMNSGSANNQAVQNIIISLRIQLGQGNVTSDFDTVFPYSPVLPESQNAPSS